jgi:Cadherin domain
MNHYLMRKLMQVIKFYALLFSGSTVMQLYANDADSGSNGFVTYSLSGSSPFFAVSSSGLVTTTVSTLNYKITPVHYLIVRACDSGFPQKCGKCVIYK